MVNEIEKIKRQIAPILKKYKAKRAGIFGNFTNGVRKKGSVHQISTLELKKLEAPIAKGIVENHILILDANKFWELIKW